jgi:hypothetical protein
MRDWRLEHFRSLQALARTGLHFCKDEYDRERYGAIERIASELLAAGAGADPAELRAEWSRDGGYVTPKVEVRGAVFRPARCCWSAKRWMGCGPCLGAGPT